MKNARNWTTEAPLPSEEDFDALDEFVKHSVRFGRKIRQQIAQIAADATIVCLWGDRAVTFDDVLASMKRLGFLPATYHPSAAQPPSQDELVRIPVFSTRYRPNSIESALIDQIILIFNELNTRSQGYVYMRLYEDFDRVQMAHQGENGLTPQEAASA